MLTRFLYRSYRWFYVQEQWRRTRLTRTGGLVLAAVFITGILGMNIFQSGVYQILILCLAFLLVAVIPGFFSKLRVDVAREVPEYAMAGKPFSYTLYLTNRGNRIERGLVLFEVPADPRPALSTLLARREPGEHLRNAWDRKTLYYRWLWLIRTNVKAWVDPVRLPDLPPNTRVRVRVTATPHARGYMNFAGVTLGRPDPLSLFHSLFRVPLPGKLLVLPPTFSMTPPQPASQRKHHPGGVFLASSVGNADEFMSLRDYRPGDSLRHIHWKTYAKTEKPAVREFEDEYFVRHALVLDTATGDEAVFETAVSIAASLLQGLGLSESLLDLMFVGNRIYSFPAGRGVARSARLLEVLACVEPRPDGAVSDLAAHIRGHLEKLSGSILILVDWDESREKLAALFQQAGLPAQVYLVCPDGAKKEMTRQVHTSEQDCDLPPVTLVAAGRAAQDLGGR